MKGKLRVLNLEDSPNDAELIAATLDAGGIDCDIIRVDTREKFIAVIDAEGADIILADYSLPAFDGLTALGLVRERFTDLPFLFVTGTMGEEVAVDSLKNGATDYILKNRLSRLVPAVLRALRETEERRELEIADIELRKNEERYRTILLSAMDGFCIFNSQLRFLDVNKSYSNMTGYSRDELLGMTINELEVVESGDDIALRVQRIINSGNERFESRQRCKGGRIIDVEVSINYLASEAKFFVFLRDISERKLAEKEIFKLNEELEQRVAERTASLEQATEELQQSQYKLIEMVESLNKSNSALQQEIKQRRQAQDEIGWLNEDLLRQRTALEAANLELESFSFSVSHDLRAPLRHIIGFARALMEECGNSVGEVAVDYLQRIVKASIKMQELIDGLLELSRVSRGELRKSVVDLSSMARDISQSLLGTSPNRKVIFNIADSLSVTADPILLRALLENLLGNAWKYTGKKETATIEFSCEERQGQRVFYIRDNGAGFDMLYVDKLFSPFQRLHKAEDFEGTGVGLATVQRIIRRHGGHAWAEAEIDKGATFYFAIP